ncbi:extracellular solute-binding protein [Catenulispora sp. NF23]|uniref:Extracellular solute-binding protein n=1 Tax=Catenulispora pinistramenti TaxID=2705254 RepID=A0ABS5KJD0_9ACTN|nr:extracellular solute-binding protein [Catenulispora pinistramenti]MBS2532169.1 extracellular solute-binding protein [Catenulispora pinistramenti]MBS2545441.1 extracellular solute-binding protein [Catenulispora pinistramenti]
MPTSAQRSGRKSAVLAAGAAVTSVVLAACGSGTSKPSTVPVAAASGTALSGQSITIYSGQHEQTMQALVKGFEAKTGVKVNVRSGDEAELANQILTEGKASPADVFVSENPPTLTTLEEKGLLAKVDADTLAAVPAADSAAAGDWIGVSARSAVFAYDTAAVPASQLPTSVKDLAGAAWKGKLGIAPSETDFTPIVTRMIQSVGADATKTWLRGLKANGKVYDSNEDLIAAINKGEVAGGVVDHYYWYRMRDEVGAGAVHSQLSYFAAGDPGSMVDVSGAGILGSSKHQPAAQAFLNYLVAQPAQQIIATSQSYEYPLLAGVAATKLAKPLSAAGPVVPATDLGDGKQALSLLQSVGLLS